MMRKRYKLMGRIELAKRLLKATIPVEKIIDWYANKEYIEFIVLTFNRDKLLYRVFDDGRVEEVR